MKIGEDRTSVPRPPYDRGVRLRGKMRRELHVVPECSPWLDPADRVVGVLRQVRVTVVSREVGAYNGFTEHITPAQLARVPEWLEETARGATGTLELGTPDEGARLEHQGEGLLVAELRGELRPWWWEEPAEVVYFELWVEAVELLRAARDLRAELEA